MDVGGSWTWNLQNSLRMVRACVHALKPTTSRMTASTYVGLWLTTQVDNFHKGSESVCTSTRHRTHGTPEAALSFCTSSIASWIAVRKSLPSVNPCKAYWCICTRLMCMSTARSRFFLENATMVGYDAIGLIQLISFTRTAPEYVRGSEGDSWRQKMATPSQPWRQERT